MAANRMSGRSRWTGPGWSFGSRNTWCMNWRKLFSPSRARNSWAASSSLLRPIKSRMESSAPAREICWPLARPGDQRHGRLRVRGKGLDLNPEIVKEQVGQVLTESVTHHYAQHGGVLHGLGEGVGGDEPAAQPQP